MTAWLHLDKMSNANDFLAEFGAANAGEISSMALRARWAGSSVFVASNFENILWHCIKSECKPESFQTLATQCSASVGNQDAVAHTAFRSTNFSALIALAVAAKIEPPKSEVLQQATNERVIDAVPSGECTACESG